MGKKISNIHDDVKLDHDLLDKYRRLTFDEKRILANRTMKKHGVAGVTLHWVNALSWGILVLTGAALISADYLRFMPQWYVQMMDGFFGERSAMLTFHISIGVFWVITLLMYGVFGFKNYLMVFVKEDLSIDKDDILWFPAKAKNLAGKISHYDMPPQGVYNAGQKAYAYVVAFGTITLMITGPIMAFHWGNESVLQWAIFLHYVATMSVLSGMFVHIYMAALFPEERPAFFSMIGGKVNELYAYLHHYKWWAELKRKEHAWFKEELEKDGQDLGPLKDCGKYEGHTD